MGNCEEDRHDVERQVSGAIATMIKQLHYRSAVLRDLSKLKTELTRLPR